MQNGEDRRKETACLAIRSSTLVLSFEGFEIGLQGQSRWFCVRRQRKATAISLPYTFMGRISEL